ARPVADGDPALDGVGRAGGRAVVTGVADHHEAGRVGDGRAAADGRTAQRQRAAVADGERPVDRGAVEVERAAVRHGDPAVDLGAAAEAERLTGADGVAAAHRGVHARLAEA